MGCSRIRRVPFHPGLGRRKLLPPLPPASPAKPMEFAKLSENTGHKSNHPRRKERRQSGCANGTSRPAPGRSVQDPPGLSRSVSSEPPHRFAREENLDPARTRKRTDANREAERDLHLVSQTARRRLQ